MHRRRSRLRRLLVLGAATNAKSIIMIAFFFTMPIRSTIPMIEITLRSIRPQQRQHGADAGDGSVEMIVVDARSSHKGCRGRCTPHERHQDEPWLASEGLLYACKVPKRRRIAPVV